MTIHADTSTAIENLLTRIDTATDPAQPRMVAFVASRPQEGTTTLARAYATASAERLRRDVLFLTARPASGFDADILGTVAAGQFDKSALQTTTPGLYEAGLGGTRTLDASWDLLGRTDLWAQLRQSFGIVVLDLPSVAASRSALRLAPLCDGVVVIVEAEKSRAPVVVSLVNDLRTVKANIIGTVLNKRRFYLPERLYRWL